LIACVLIFVERCCQLYFTWTILSFLYVELQKPSTKPSNQHIPRMFTKNFGNFILCECWFMFIREKIHYELRYFLSSTWIPYSSWTQCLESR